MITNKIYNTRIVPVVVQILQAGTTGLITPGPQFSIWLICFHPHRVNDYKIYYVGS